MDVLIRDLLLSVTLVFSFSCSQLDYLAKQGQGQMRLLWGAIDNRQALQSTQLSEDQKFKIKKIEVFRDYFYRYWQEKPRDTYQTFYQLKEDAVSYLVILSPIKRVEASEHCFPFAGCFPYLGFFDQEDAVKFSKEKEGQGLVTWIRPVYAYSTLGYFDDPILSSFFHYDELELAQLVFHELFHTIFFLEDQVELNENLANFVADRMVENYFSFSETDRQKLDQYLKQREWEDQGLKQLVRFSEQLNSQYEKSSNLKPQDILRSFTKSQIMPWVENYCQGMEKCWAKELEYNNASLAAYLTYEAQDSRLSEWYGASDNQLIPMIDKVRKLIADYKKSDKKVELVDYLQAGFQ